MNKKNTQSVSPVANEMKKTPVRKKKLNRKSPSLLALEARLMFDGAVAQTIDQTATQPEALPPEPIIADVEEASADLEAVSYAQPKDEIQTEVASVDSSEGESLEVMAQTDSDVLAQSSDGESEANESLLTGPQRVVLVSGYLPELDQIISGLPTDASIHILRADGQIVEEISQILSGFDQIDELHIVSHGHPGSLVFGTEVLDTEALNSQADQIRAWGNRLSANADILLYGCDVAAEETGVVFLKTLQGLTSADIAASDDATGASTLGADALLEVHFGEIESTPVLTSELLDRLDLVLDTTPPHVSAVELNVTDTTMRVTLTMSEAIAENPGLTESQLRVTIAGVDRFATYVAPVTGNLLTSDPTVGRVVYALTGVTGADLALGVTLGRVVLNASNAPVEDVIGNDLVPVEINQLLSRIHVDAGESVTFNGGFGGSGDFVKTGAGELILFGNNVHSGRTIIEGGTLSINNDLRLGATTNTGPDRIVIKDGATLKVTETLTLTTGRGIEVAGSGRIEVASGAVVTYGGVIRGADTASGLTKVGAGELILSGISTFTGPVHVDEGRLKLSTANRLVSSIEMNVGAAGVLDMSAGSQTFGSLAGAGRVEIAAAALTLGGNNLSTTFSGDLVGTSGSLVKQGAGVLTLSGQSTYTGVTTVNAGTTASRSRSGLESIFGTDTQWRRGTGFEWQVSDSGFVGL